MDDRVADLVSELGTSTSIDPLAARNRIVDLFGQVSEEQDRVTLRMVLDSVIGLAIRSQEAEGIDPQPLRDALLTDKRILAIQEAMGPNELAEPTKLFRVLEREVAAGRMEQDEFYDLAVAGAKALGSPKKAREKTGFFRRLLG